MDNTDRGIENDQSIGYEVMNAASNITAVDITKLYYCEADSSKAKTYKSLPTYPNSVRVVISK